VAQVVETLSSKCEALNSNVDKVKGQVKVGDKLVPVAYPYNPSYSGGRDQEDHGSKPALA
jgi:hypothetical protein